MFSKKKKILTLLIVLVIPLSTFNSCKKTQLNRLGNILLVNIPNNCQDCAVVLIPNDYWLAPNDMIDESVVTILRDSVGRYMFTPYTNGIGTELEFAIDWSETTINPFKAPWANNWVVIQLIKIREGASGIEIMDFVWSTGAEFEPGHKYLWESNGSVMVDNLIDITEEESEEPTPTSLLGTWMREDGNCVNQDGMDDFFKFDNNNFGEHFLSDCSNQCPPYGVHFPFQYEVRDTVIEMSYSNSYYYCSKIFSPPHLQISLPYKRIGNILTIDGIEYKYQQN